jgi:hypothetical protein
MVTLISMVASKQSEYDVALGGGGTGHADPDLDRDKVKGYGKLRVVGTLEGKELEIYGNLSVNGRL